MGKRNTKRTCDKCCHVFHGRRPVTGLCTKCYAESKGMSTACSQCGKELPRERIARKTSDRGRAIYCNTKCRSAAQCGHQHHSYKGGRFVDAGGYIKVRVGRKYIPEHRIIVEASIGRKLLAWETVHHKDGDKQNNAISNLQLMGSRHPKGQFFSDYIDVMSSRIIQENAGCFVARDLDCPKQLTVVHVKSGHVIYIPLV